MILYTTIRAKTQVILMGDVAVARRQVTLSELMTESAACS